MRYVAQYVQKKIYDGKNGAYYTNRGQVELYNISSKGLGKRTALKHEKTFEENNYTYPNGEGHIKPLSRYYIKLWRERDLKAYLKLNENIAEKKIPEEEILHEKNENMEKQYRLQIIKTTTKTKNRKRKII